MAGENEHGKLIASAAKAALTPLGCKRKGRSRLWIADQRFWAIVVEFQPSGWQQGSYLNVAAMWLWYAKDWSLDYFHSDHPQKEFFPFVDEQQFAPIAERLASAAADQVTRLRKELASPRSVARCLVARVNANPWSIYNAAIAAGLIGDVTASQQLFQRLETSAAPHAWQKDLQAKSAAICAQLSDPTGYRAAVSAEVGRCRALLNLAPDPKCLEDAA